MASTQQAKRPRSELRARPPRAIMMTAKERRTFSVEYELDKRIFDLAKESQTTYSELVESALRKVYGGPDG